jgi:AraC-like DNA-binding protein
VKPGPGGIFETAEQDSAEHILSAVYGTSMRIDAHGQRRGMRLVQVPLTPAVRLDRITFRMSFDADATPRGVLFFGSVTSGVLRHASDGSQRLMRPGDVYLAAQPDHSHATTVMDTETETAVIDPALPSQIAETEPGRAQQPVRFTGYEPVSPRAARVWKDTYAYVRDTVLDQPGTFRHPLIASSAARLLVAAALATFPSNVLTDPTIEDRHDAHPATLRRAMAFIDEHAQRDVTTAEIAAAAHVSIRALQLAFRRHLGTSPVVYLRRVRLDHAHRDLLAADPAGQTVTAIAYRWGFHSSSRFAHYYQKVYGVAPSRTLRGR